MEPRFRWKVIAPLGNLLRMSSWMQKTCCNLALVLSLMELPSTAQEWAWAQRYGGQGAEAGTGIVIDSAGSQYLSGWFESSAAFGEQVLTVTGHRDAFFGKWDADGNLSWVEKAGGKDEDYASSVALDPEGHPVFLGTFRSETASFGGIILTNKFARDDNSLFIVKLNAQGKGLWAQQVGGASTYDAASIQTDSAGNVYLVACMARFANFGVTNLTGYEDILVAKYDADGNLAWARKAGGSGYDYGHSLVVTSGGVAYVTGTFEKEADFGGVKLASRGQSDLFLAKFSTDGEVVWATQAGGTSQDGTGILAIDPEGGVLLSGSFRGTATVGTNVVTALASAFDQDVFLARYDGFGNVRWVRQVGHTAQDVDTPGSLAVKVTTDGTTYYTNVFFSGHFYSAATIGPVTLTNTTAQTMFLSKWNLDGEVLWVRQGAGNDSVIACDDSPAPVVYVTGQFSAPSAWRDQWLHSQGNSDLFHARLDSGAPALPPTAPSLVKSPQATAVAGGTALQLSVEVTGTPPVTYRWRKDNRALWDGNRMFGSGTARFTIHSTQPEDAGSYDVVVNNPYGSATSTVAVVTVGPSTSVSGPNWNWVRTLGGTSSDATSALTSDGSGHVWAAGSFQNTNVIGNYELIAPKNARHVFLARYDASGSVQWAGQIGGEKTETASALVTDSQGHLYVTGDFTSAQCLFGSLTLTNAQAGDSDLFLAKYSPQGSLEWALSGSGTRDDVSRGLALDSDGNVVIEGDFSSPTLTLGGHVITNIGGTDVLVAKLTPQGEVLWVRNAGYSATHEGNAVAVDAARNVYAAGKLWGRTRFGQTELDSHFDHDTFLAKWNADGEILWARQLGSLSVTVARSLAVDLDGNLIMAGYLDQTCDFDESTVIAHGSHDVFLAKFNPQGGVIWARNFGGPGSDTPRSLALDSARNIYLTGSFTETADFGGVTLMSGGQRDLFLVLCDSMGQVSWAKQAGGTRADDGFALAAGGPNQVFVGGSFFSVASFDALAYSSNEGSADAFLARLGGEAIPAEVRLSNVRPGNQLQISGPAGSTVIIQATTDLGSPANWQPLTNLVLPGSVTTWTDPQPADLRHKFYRARIQP